MFKFTQESVARKATSKVPAAERSTVCYVTPGQLGQAVKKGLNQAAITISGADAEALDTYRGDVILKSGEAEFRLTKTDSHLMWASRQGDNLEAFGELFNLLVDSSGAKPKPRKPVPCSIRRA